MAFESLAFRYEFEIPSFPPEWLPLTYLYDPDLPLFPIQYFHLLDPALPSEQRPGERDRLFGFIHHINLNGNTLLVNVVINKDLASPLFRHYCAPLEEEVRARLGLENPVTLSDISASLSGGLSAANPLVLELWYQIVGGAYGGKLPFGRMWDAVLGLVRYVASYRSDGGRKGELIQTHDFASELGVTIQTAGGIHADFFLLPTMAELTDVSNPLSYFPKFSELVRGADEFVTRYCEPVVVGSQSYSAFQFAKTGVSSSKLDSEAAHEIISKATAGYRKALSENFSAFNRGPFRSHLFLMMLHDLRHGMWRASTLTATECGQLYSALSGSYQSPKVLTLYAQQCAGNESVLPVDLWVETFLKSPLDFRPSRPKLYHQELFACSNKWGKIERLIWVAGQARKVHASVCKEILWCVRFGDPDKLLRGANPFACKICRENIRSTCPSYARIAGAEVSFNAPAGMAIMGAAKFNVVTSAGDNSHGGQLFRSVDAPELGTRDVYSPNDRPESFRPYPQAGHSGTKLTVSEFIESY